MSQSDSICRFHLVFKAIAFKVAQLSAILLAILQMYDFIYLQKWQNTLIRLLQVRLYVFSLSSVSLVFRLDITSTVPAKIEKKTRKRKSKTDKAGGPPEPASKKQDVGIKPEVEQDKSHLSDQDKKLMERWKNMQKDTKPFIHPIRKHMDELIKIKSESIALVKQPQVGIPAGNMQQVVRPSSTLQFTNFVPKEKGGAMSLVPEQTFRLVSQNVAVKSEVGNQVSSSLVSTSQKQPVTVMTTPATTNTTTATSGWLIINFQNLLFYYFLTLGLSLQGL